MICEYSRTGVFVASQTERLARHRLLHEEKMHNALKLVVSNVKKEGDSTKMRESEVRDELGLKGVSHFQVKVIEVNAFTAEGFDVLLNQICKSMRLL